MSARKGQVGSYSQAGCASDSSVLVLLSGLIQHKPGRTMPSARTSINCLLIRQHTTSSECANVHGNCTAARPLLQLLTMQLQACSQVLADVH